MRKIVLACESKIAVVPKGTTLVITFFIMLRARLECPLNSVLSFHLSFCPQANTQCCDNVVVRSEHCATNAQCCSNVDATTSKL